VKPDRELLTKLKGIPLFEDLSDRELRAIYQQGRVVEHVQDKEVLEEGGGSVGFHLILDGDASVLQAGKVRRQLGPGDYFGEISLLDGKPRSATIRADTALRTFSVAEWGFRPLLDNQPKLARKLLIGLCALLRSSEARQPLP
jgi:CRP/FNR family cyclic AMP-dependent transcriptional regulator